MSSMPSPLSVSYTRFQVWRASHSPCQRTFLLDSTSSEWKLSLYMLQAHTREVRRFPINSELTYQRVLIAQFYISCGQINVTGGGSGSPGPLVAIPGVYTGNEPGIMINIYYRRLLSCLLQIAC